MSERDLQITNPQESSSRLRSGINLVSRYETAIVSGATISSAFWLERANDVVGIRNEINPVTLAELSTLLLMSSVCATSIRFRDKPSQVLKSIGYIVTEPLRRKAKSE